MLTWNWSPNAISKSKRRCRIWQQAGFTSAEPVSGDTLAAVARLEEEDGDHYFITFKNFYVITRYNRSPLYAMAVYELSEAIRNGFEAVIHCCVTPVSCWR